MRSQCPSCLPLQDIITVLSIKFEDETIVETVISDWFVYLASRRHLSYRQYSLKSGTAFPQHPSLLHDLVPCMTQKKSCFWRLMRVKCSSMHGPNSQDRCMCVEKGGRSLKTSREGGMMKANTGKNGLLLSHARRKEDAQTPRLAHKHQLLWCAKANTAASRHAYFLDAFWAACKKSQLMLRKEEECFSSTLVTLPAPDLSDLATDCGGVSS